jgi:hypothetical protein
MAWRMPPPLPPSTPWDVLRPSTTGGALGRILLRPLTSWLGATFSSLPLGFRGGCGGYAPCATIIDGPGVSLDTITGQFGCGGIDFDVGQAAGTGDSGPWRGFCCGGRPARSGPRV